MPQLAASLARAPSEEAVTLARPTPAHWPEILAVLETANFHRIGGPEMAAFPLEDCFVALVEGRVRGVGGYRILSDRDAKTTLLAVHPAYAHLGLGSRLQAARLAHLRSLGVRTVRTNADDPRVIRWLERRWGFRRTGETVPKEEDFGRPDVAAWTSLRLDWPEPAAGDAEEVVSPAGFEPATY